jgi:hypothetical protein
MAQLATFDLQARLFANSQQRLISNPFNLQLLFRKIEELLISWEPGCLRRVAGEGARAPSEDRASRNFTSTLRPKSLDASPFACV